MKTKTFLALCVLAFITAIPISKIHGQIVYSNIKDTTIYIPNAPYADSSNYYFFDINNDLVMDFRFVTTTFFDGGYHPPHTAKAIGLTPATFPSLHYIAGGCFGYNTYLINSGDTINKNRAWNFAQYIKYIQTAIDWSCEVPTGEFFLGLKLVISPDTLYGWVRCTATDTSVTVYDYAYNTASNSYILAGQTTSGIETNSLNNSIRIYSSCQTLNVEFDEVQSQGTISLINIMGQVLQTFPVSGNHNEIPINSYNSGIYLLKIATPKFDYNKTIYLP